MYKNQENLQILTQMYNKFELESTKELTDHAVKILDAKYKKKIYHKLSTKHEAILQSPKNESH